MTAVKCNQRDCIHYSARKCRAEYIAIDWVGEGCKQYDTTKQVMERSPSLNNRAKLKDGRNS
jgi:hypothetical protein